MADDEGQRIHLAGSVSLDVGVQAGAPEQAFAEGVRAMRQARGWSQAELAVRLGEYGFRMHQTTVAKLEAGERPIRINEAAALCTLFGVQLIDVLSGGRQPEGDVATLQQRVDAAQDSYDQLRALHTDVVRDHAEAQGKARALEAQVQRTQVRLTQAAEGLARARAELRAAVEKATAGQ